jgi:formylglycine-generating enzyme required for sulfatase activity
VKKAGISDTGRFPVDGVSWDDCQEFLKRMNASAKAAAVGRGKFVLPHEDEWEYACRGDRGNKQPFYFGARLNGAQANCDGNYPNGTDTRGEYKGRTTAVGSYVRVAPHPWGLCDMHGNVWQWCDNLYNKDSIDRVLRGGSWRSRPAYCRAARRIKDAPSCRFKDLGFRVAFRLD